MSKPIKAIIIALCFLVIIAAAFSIMYFAIQRDVKDKNGMINTDYFLCEYSELGGMEGAELYISLENVASDEATLTYREKENAGAEETEYTVTAPSEAVERIRSIYNSYGVESWGELPKNDVIALDAPTVQVHFATATASVTVSSNDELPENCGRLFSEIYSVLIEFKK
ncbi:MAG: hypothetical protein ACI4IK_07880 [Eubacterium sp.]